MCSGLSTAKNAARLGYYHFCYSTRSKKIFHKTYDTGLKHGTVTVILEKEHYEITTYRIEKEYYDCRHPSEVIFTKSLKEDLQRRDFTINAMAYHPKEGIQDYFCGQEHLKQKKYRE